MKFTKNAEGQIVCSEADLQEFAKEVSKETGESIKAELKLNEPAKLPGAPGSEDGATTSKELGEKYAEKKDETASAKKKRLAAAVVDVKGGKLSVEDAPKEIKTIRFFKAQAEGDMATVKALSEGSNTDGGYLVPTEFATDVLVAIEEYGVVKRDADVYPMTSDTLDLRSVTTKPTIYQVAESVAPSDAATKFGLPVLTAKAFAGAQVMSKELFQDNNVGLYQKLVVLFGEAFAKRTDNEGLIGTTFTGVMNSAANIVTLASASYADVTYKELVKIKRSLSKGQLMTGYKWYMNRQVLAAIEGIVDGNGRPIVFNSLTADGITQLLGVPVELNEALPSTDAANSPFIIFGNLKWLAYGERQGLQSEMAKEGTVQGINLLEQRSYALFMDLRFGITVTIPSNITVVKTHA